MPDLETLQVRIEADLGQFKRQLDTTFQESQAAVDGARGRIEDYGRSLARLPDALATGAVGHEAFQRAVDTNARDLDAASNAADSLAAAARDLGLTFASAFEDAVVEGRRLSDVLRGLERDILRILTRKLVTEPLAGAVSSLVGDGQALLGDVIGASLFHRGGKVGASGADRRLVPASFFQDAPRFAGGGVVGAIPRLGPGEVPAILHRGETVRTPAQEAARVGEVAGAVIIQPGAVVIQTPDPASFDQSRGQIEAMLADAVRRGRRNR